MSHSKLKKPSAIQAQCWTSILSGQDVVAIGATGSGKTIAYLLPLVPHVLANRQPGCITALVLLPTRELALQVSTVARSFRSLFGVSCYTVYGGVNKAEQEEYLSRVGTDVLMASPGRLHDLHTAGKAPSVALLFRSQQTSLLGEQVRELSSLCLPETQRLVFSATFPEHIRDAVLAFVAPSCIQVKVQEHAGATTLGSHIKQTLHVTSDALHKKLRKLLRTLIQIKSEYAAANPQARNRPSVIVFVNKIKTVSSVVGFLQKSSQLIGTSRGLFGAMKQAEREEIVKGFRAGKLSNLVTTDLAGRGMDIKNLNHVINFDFPPTIAQYIHRIGQGETETMNEKQGRKHQQKQKYKQTNQQGPPVGRAGRQGQASSTFTFFTRNRSGLAPHILEVLRQTKQWEDPNLLLLCKEIESESKSAGEGEKEEERLEEDDEGDARVAREEDAEEIDEPQEKEDSSADAVPIAAAPTARGDAEIDEPQEKEDSSADEVPTAPIARKVVERRKAKRKKSSKSSDPFALPSWLLRTRTVVPDSDDDEPPTKK